VRADLALWARRPGVPRDPPVSANMSDLGGLSCPLGLSDRFLCTQAVGLL